MKTVNHLGTDPIGKLVPRIAFPSMLAQFVSVLYSIVDRMYIGHIASVGDLALAGVGVCGPILTMIGAFSSLIGVGGAPLLGIRLGEKNEKEASRILANAFLMLVSLSLVLTAAALFFTRPMLMAFGASTVTYPYARAYFVIYVSGSVFALLSTGLNQFVICQGFASEGMKSVLLGAVLNLLLDPVFIFVLHLGVRGAAIATVLSQIASCLYVLHILFGKTIPIRITFGGYSFAIMKRILTVGFTPFLIIAIDNVMIIAMNAVLQRYAPAGQGDSFITCATIVQSFMLIITIPLGGISGGTQSILAYNYGAGNSRRILKGTENHHRTLCRIYDLDVPRLQCRRNAVCAAFYFRSADRLDGGPRDPYFDTLSHSARHSVRDCRRLYCNGPRALFVCTLLLPEIRLLYRSVSSAAVLCTGKHLLRGTYFRPDRAGCLNDRLLDFDSEDSETAGRGGTADAHKKSIKNLISKKLFFSAEFSKLSPEKNSFFCFC